LKAVAALCLSLFLFTLGAARAGAAPSLVYSVNQVWEDVAVDSAGNAYVLIDHYVAKLSPQGQLIFQRRVDLRSQWPVAIAVDPAGYIYIAGTGNFADPREVGSGVNEAYEAFVAKVSPDATSVIYETFFTDHGSTHGLDLAVDSIGKANLLYSTQAFDGITYVARFSPAGSFSGWGGGQSSFVTAMALGPSGSPFTVGWVLKPDHDDWQVYLGKMDVSSGAIIDTLLDDNATFSSWFLDVAATPGDGAVVVGRKSEGLYVAEVGPTGEEVFSRVLNLGAVEIHDVAVTSSGHIVLVGRITSSGGSDAFVLWLEGGTGEVISSMILGGSGNDGAESVAAGPGGDAYVAGATKSPDFPAVNSPQPFPDLRSFPGTTALFLARIKENQPPDCSGATASPSMIWPPNGKMVPVSTLGVADPDGDPISVKITGITQDEPGAAFSGIGFSVAQVKAERDGKGDGRVYRIQFEAADPSGASCTGKVTVCVPHDQGKGICVDSNP
jgi:hypothetical protein